jgi:hypothetical protein
MTDELPIQHIFAVVNGETREVFEGGRYEEIIRPYADDGGVWVEAR